MCKRPVGTYFLRFSHFSPFSFSTLFRKIIEHENIEWLGHHSKRHRLHRRRYFCHSIANWTYWINSKTSKIRKFGSISLSEIYEIYEIYEKLVNSKIYSGGGEKERIKGWPPTQQPKKNKDHTHSWWWWCITILLRHHHSLSNFVFHCKKWNFGVEENWKLKKSDCKWMETSLLI